MVGTAARAAREDGGCAVIDQWQYLIVLALCVAVTLPLELVLGARVYRRPRRLVKTLLPVLAVFVTWDLLASWHGDWWFSEQYTVDLWLLTLPVEEWLFFVVVPICALLTYEVLGRRGRRADDR